MAGTAEATVARIAPGTAVAGIVEHTVVPVTQEVIQRAMPGLMLRRGMLAAIIQARVIPWEAIRQAATQVVGMAAVVVFMHRHLRRIQVYILLSIGA